MIYGPTGPSSSRRTRAEESEQAARRETARKWAGGAGWILLGGIALVVVCVAIALPILWWLGQDGRP